MSETKFFKETWVGKIPNDWNLERLGDESLSKIIMGQSPPSSTYNKDKVGLPFLQGKTEFGEIYPSAIVYCSKPIKVAEPNDVLFSVRAPVGDVNIAPCRLCIGRGLAAIRFKEVANHVFYFYYLQKIKTLLKALGKGSTFKAINKGDLENLKVPLPSLREQRGIVEVLSVVDLAIGKVDEVIAKTERLKKGLTQQLLTKGIGHKEFKETKIGKTPKEWTVIKLGDVINQRKEIVQPSGEGKNRFIGLEHITSGETAMQSYDLDTNVKSSKFKFYARDILYGKLRPYLDKAVLVDFNGICSTDLLVLTTQNGKALEKFLVYVTHSNGFIRHAISTTSGTNHPRTSWKAISKFKFGLPPLPEQQKIAEILSSADRKLELERKEKTKLGRIKRGLMDLLLTGKVRVKVAD